MRKITEGRANIEEREMAQSLEGKADRKGLRAAEIVVNIKY